MVTRTWLCLNRNCLNEFDSQLDYPPCENCGGIKVKWVPKPVAIMSGGTRHADRTAEKLAQDYKLTNFRTPERGMAAKRPAAASQRAGTIEYKFPKHPGWEANIPAGTAACVPTGVTERLPARETGDSKIKMPSNPKIQQYLDSSTVRIQDPQNLRLK